MTIEWARPAVRGAERYFSAYLLSAFLMLLGGYLSLHESRVWPELRGVFLAQTAYQACLLASLAYLVRIKRAAQEVNVLVLVLLAFVFDAFAIQHFLGWDEPSACLYAGASAASGLLILAGLAIALRLPATDPRVLFASGVVLFFRLGPLVLRDESPLTSQVLFGYLLAACLLSLFVSRPRSRAELLPIGAALALAIVHFRLALVGANVPFNVASLCPFVVLLSPALEIAIAPHVRERLSESRSIAFRRLVDWLPIIGLGLSAGAEGPPLLDRPWAWRLPFTPFFLAVLLVSFVSTLRAIRSGRRGLLLVAAVSGSLATLGGDLPEALMRILHPETWQVVAVCAFVWCVLAAVSPGAVDDPVSGKSMGTQASRDGLFRWAMAVHSLSAAVLASAAAARGHSWLAIYLAVLAWGLLILTRLYGTPLRPRDRLVLGVLLGALPLTTSGPLTGPVLFVALAQFGLLSVFWALTRDPLPLLSVAAGVGILIPRVLLSSQLEGDVSAGRLATHAAFTVLFAAILNSILGTAIRARVGDFWRAFQASSQQSGAAGGPCV